MRKHIIAVQVVNVFAMSVSLTDAKQSRNGLKTFTGYKKQENPIKAS